jgi:hypothetical protein
MIQSRDLFQTGRRDTVILLSSLWSAFSEAGSRDEELTGGAMYGTDGGSKLSFPVRYELVLETPENGCRSTADKAGTEESPLWAQETEIRTRHGGLQVNITSGKTALHIGPGIQLSEQLRTRCSPMIFRLAGSFDLPVTDHGTADR